MAEPNLSLRAQLDALQAEHAECGRAVSMSRDAAELRREVTALRAQLDEAMKVLAPSMPESGLVDACRQVKQAAISAAHNSDAACAQNEALHARVAVLEKVREAAQRVRMWIIDDGAAAPLDAALAATEPSTEATRGGDQGAR